MTFSNWGKGGGEETNNDLRKCMICSEKCNISHIYEYTVTALVRL